MICTMETEMAEFRESKDHFAVIPMCLVWVLYFLKGPHSNGNVIKSSEL